MYKLDTNSYCVQKSAKFPINEKIMLNIYDNFHNNKRIVTGM